MKKLAVAAALSLALVACGKDDAPRYTTTNDGPNPGIEVTPLVPDPGGDGKR